MRDFGPNLIYPALAFRGDTGNVHTFLDEESWQSHHYYLVGGTLLVNAAGETWDVTTEVIPWAELGPIRAFIGKTFFKNSPPLKYFYSPARVMDWPEVRDRVCASIAANEQLWAFDELTAGEDGPPISETEQAKTLVEMVRQTRDTLQLVTLLESDYFDHRGRPADSRYAAP